MTSLAESGAQLPPSDDSLFEHIAVELETRGYVILPGGLPQPVTESLVHSLSTIEAAHFRPAAIGRGQEQVHNNFVRRDKIFWIDERQPHNASWHDWTQRLKSYLNRRLFLGLFSFESHFAIYEPGDFYKKHVDAFRGESNRVLTLVTYLNMGWEPDQGGELVMYSPTDDAEMLKVAPGFGTLVLFLSEEFPHEVLPAQRERYSVAGWFRVNGSLNEQIDPPR